MKRESCRKNLAISPRILAACLLFFCTTAMRAENIDFSFLPVAATPGRVSQMVRQPDGRLIVVGEFKSVDASPRSYVARLNMDGSVDTSFTPGYGANNAAYSVALQPDGRILVGGSFSNFNGVPSNRLVRLHPHGSVDRTFNLPGDVWAITVQADGKILVGGSYTALILRFHADGTPDTAFQSNPGPFSGTVSSITIGSDSKIYLGGSFSNWGTTETGGFIRLHESGGRDTTFNPGGSGVSGAVVQSAFLADGKILVAGVFLFVNGVGRRNIARLNADGSLDQTFSAVINGFELEGSVQSLIVLPNGQIVIGGSFITFGGVSNRMARLNPSGDWDNSFNIGTGFDTTVHDMEPDGDGFIVAGSFRTVDASPRFAMAKLSSSGSLDTVFAPGFGLTADVFAVRSLADGRILIGGTFDLVNGRPRTKMAVLNADGSLDETFILPMIEGTNVRAFDIQPDGKILVGGQFPRVNGVNNRTLIRLHPDGNLDMAFIMHTLLSDGIYKLEVLGDGKILVAGDFSAASQSGTNFARLNADGSVDTTFNLGSGFNGTTTDLEVQSDGKIVVIGVFTNVAGVARPGVARLNENGTVDKTFSVSIGNLNTIHDVALQTDGKIILAGGFQTVNGSPRHVIVRLNQDSSVDNSLASPFAGGGASRVVIRPNGKILLGGILAIHSQTRGFVQLNGDGRLNNSINPDIGGSTDALEIGPDGTILAAGRYDLFRTVPVSQSPQPSLVRLIPRAIDFDFDADGRTDLAIFRPSVAEWWINRSSTSETIAAQFGASTDEIAPADYTGDEKTDVAFFRPSTGEWYILRSENNSFYSFPFGASEDIPTPADYDADGKADPAVFRPSTATWFIQRSSDNGTTIAQFGATGDHPVAADYDGDGKADLAIYRPSNGQWWINRSTAGVIVHQFGDSNDKLVPGDYTGDGKADVAFWRPSTGEWYILRSEDNSYYSAPFGTSTDIPAPGDYDGDGKFDTTVFRPSSATWFSQRTTSGTLIQQFGATGDTPIPNAFIP